MALVYKHGVYGEVEASNYSGSVAQGTIPTYIGSLPIHRINAAGDASFDYSKYVNTPILISSYREIKDLGIYSDEWSAYTLCEALKAHFTNGQEVIAPIILINMLNPSTDIASAATTTTVSMSKEGTSYIGYINDPLCCLDEIAITATDVTFSAGEVTTAYEGDRVKITVKKSGFNKTEVSASYKKINFAVDDVETTAFDAALAALDNIEPITTYLTNVVVAPCFSEKPDFHELLIQKVITMAAEKWRFIAVSDIPSTSTVNTIEKAKAWKKSNQYNNKYDKVCWPAAAGGDKIYHASVLAAFLMQRTDYDNNDVPFVSPSNKILHFIDRVCLADGTTMYIKEYEGNELNKVGITTFNFIRQNIRLWGSHMANYDFMNLSMINPEDRFDVSIRMSIYLLNYLMYNHLNSIDESFSKKDIDSITNSAQTWLDSLVNEGMLLYASIRFDEASNSEEALMDGNITFDLEVTYPVCAKSITFRLQYTKTGLTTLFSTGGAA